MLKKVFQRLRFKLRTNNICEIFPDDIFLVSYPKSGNTWLRFLIANYMTNNKCDFTNSHLIIPDIHFNPQQLHNIERPRFIKSHLSFTSQYNRVIYLVRDGRDVAVSYYFHLHKYNQIKSDLTFKKFLARFNNGNLNNYPSWSYHANSWINKKTHNLLVIKYENLILNPVLELQNILKFANKKINDNQVKSAVEASSFERMKCMEENQHHKTNLLSNSNKDISFVRRGKPGNWKLYFDDKDNDKFIQKHGKLLRKLGYLDNVYL